MEIPDAMHDIYLQYFFNQTQQELMEFDVCPYNISSNLSHVVMAEHVYPSDLAVPLYGYALPFIVITTGIANTLIFLVLIQKHMRTPTNMVLLAISISDLFTLVIPAPILFYMYTFGNHEQPIYPVSLCYAWYLFYDVLPNAFHTSSIWLTLALGVQRYIYVCHPPIARLYCNIPRVTKVIFGIFLAAWLHQMPKFFEYGYHGTCVFWEDKIIPACYIYINEWLWHSYDLYYATYFIFRLVFVHLGPCTILVLLNILLFKALRKAEGKRKKLLRENRKREYMKIRDNNCTTMMLIVILSVFLITEIPLAVITLLHIMSSRRFLIQFSENEYQEIGRFIIVSNFFITLSYPINFAIYCGMSRQFLETFRETFCKRQSNAGTSTNNHRPSISTALCAKSKCTRNEISNDSNQYCITSIPLRNLKDHSEQIMLAPTCVSLLNVQTKYDSNNDSTEDKSNQELTSFEDDQNSSAKCIDSNLAPNGASVDPSTETPL